MTHNLILAAAEGYRASQLKPFLVSARHHVGSAAVVLFGSDASPQHAQAIAELNPKASVVIPADARLRKIVWLTPRVRRTVRDLLRPVWGWSTPAPLHRLLSALLTVELARYLWAHAYLREHPVDGSVLLADSRDVFFQGDPFEDSSGCLVSGEEPISIGNCPYNSEWINRVFSRACLTSLASKPVLCSGVTLADYRTMCTYLDAMVGNIERNRARLMKGRGSDQGLHNKILHGDAMVPFASARNGEGLIATLHYSDLTEFNLDADGLKTRHGDAVKIVHQYDRRPVLQEWVENRYGAGV